MTEGSNSLLQDELQTRDGKKEKKALIEFGKANKKLVLNKTNAFRIADLYGPETDAWIGKQVTLYPEKVSAFGKMVDAIRILPEVPKNGQGGA